MVQKTFLRFDLTEHATNSARAIRNLGHAVGDHRDRCPRPDHHCRRLVRDSMMSRTTGLSCGLCPELRGFVAAVAPSAHRFTGSVAWLTRTQRTSHNATHPHRLSHFVFPDCESSPRCVADLVFYRCMRMNPLAPPAGGAFFMRAVLCATGDASAALSGGFAGQRQRARSLPSGGQRVSSRQAHMMDQT